MDTKVIRTIGSKKNNKLYELLEDSLNFRFGRTD